MTAIRVASTSLTLLASTSSSSAYSYCHSCTLVFTKFRFGPILDISISITNLSSRRANRMAHSIARATLGLTQPNKVDPPKISFAAKEIDLVEWKGDILAVGVTVNDMAKDDNSKFKNSILQKLDLQLGGLLSEASSEEDFTGKAGQSTVLRIPGFRSKRVSLIGLGSSTSATAAYRSLGEAVAAAAKSVQANNAAITLASSEAIPAETKPTTASAIATGAMLGTFDDNRFKSESKKQPTLQSVDIIGLGSGAEIEKNLKYAQDVCSGIILGKELVNAPANVLTPRVLAEEATKIASKYSDVFTAKILQEITAALFQGSSSFTHLKHIHARLMRFDLHQNHYLLNRVLKSVFHFNHPDYAMAVFSQTREPNFYLYNTMIRGLVSNDCFNQAIELFHSMREEGFSPNNFTFPFVLKSCARNMDFGLGVKVHSLAVKIGFDDDVFVKTGLVGFYAKLESLEDAQKVFDDIDEKNVVSWTAIMSGYIGARRFREVVDLFRKSLDMGLKPDSYTLVRVLSACSHLGDLTAGEWIHKYILDIGMGRNVFVSTALVDMYTKCGNMEKARAVFDEMPERDIVTWGAMIQGYAANGHPKEALEIFHIMRNYNLHPDCYTIVGVLSACARLGALELGERARNMMDKNEFLSNPVMGTALVDMYAKCGKITAALEVFKEMKFKDVVIFNAFISGLAMTGHVKAAFSCFTLLQKCGLKPDENTFLGLLCGCTHAGLVSDGRRYFHHMSSLYSLSPTIEHYGTMVDLLARAGLLNEAHQIVKSMPMKANAIVWGALLGGCRLHKDSQLAEHVLKRLIELEPWNSGNYVLLSNIYSANQKWEESENIRSTMKEKGIQKVRGYSWIEMDGIVHEFLVGDTYHPMSDDIYAKLAELEKELREGGYVPTTEFVLFDIEEEEKEHFLGCHSEKLALAFGLISSKSNDVIRIVKNLRVCGDCHTAIKLISKITGREIIVRDTNRFHHFVDGACSCRDYW